MRSSARSAGRSRSRTRSSRSRACTASTRSSGLAGSRGTSSSSAGAALPRVGLAALRIEGQLPKLRTSMSRRWAGVLFAVARPRAACPGRSGSGTRCPTREVAHHWDLAWAGFDVVSRVALLGTAFALLTGRPGRAQLRRRDRGAAARGRLVRHRHRRRRPRALAGGRPRGRSARSRSRSSASSWPARGRGVRIGT